MILTCPECGTQYVVKDGAIPPQGRQVRCASCKHSWHQDPEPSDAPAEEETVAEAAMIDPSTGPEAEERAYQEASLAAADQPADGSVEEPAMDEQPETGAEAEPEGSYEPVEPPVEDVAQAAPAGPVSQPEYQQPAMAQEPAAPAEEPVDDDFRPFRYEAEDEPRGRSPVVSILLVALLIAALAAAFWFLAPAEWKQRVGIAGAGDTPLQLMMTHSDRQKLASGNELLAVSGRVINPTDESQDVPPIRAQLRSTTGKLVYSWTIAPPARTLPPGASATFNSAEVNVPAGGDELTITLGSVKS
jgi:predicted Zn finger-like uncharacterized protein